MIASVQNKSTSVHASRAPELSDVDKQHLTDFEFALKLIRTRTTSVACGYHTGVYLPGRSGSSKTYSVIKELERLDVPWAYRNGRMSPFGLFDFCASIVTSTVVLDDIPSLLQHRQALQIFVAALGGVPRQPRPVTYTVKGAEGRQCFDFSGGIIAIANEPLRRGPLADAVQSRVVLLEHEPSDAQLAAFIRHQALKGFKDLTVAECWEVASFVIDESKAAEYRIDLRSYVKGVEDYRQDKDGKAERNWKDMVRSSMTRIVKNDNVAPVGRDENQAWLRRHALDVHKRFPLPRQKSQRDAAWAEITKRSPDVLYVQIRRLKTEGLVG